MVDYKKPADVLLIEDNQADVDIIREAVKDGRHPVRLHVIHDGETAIQYLLRPPLTYIPHHRPDLILLDLNLPGRSGKEVLLEIKNTSGLASIPVIVLSGSQSLEEAQEVSRLQANCFITKPSGYADFVKMLNSMLHFWLYTARPA